MKLYDVKGYARPLMLSEEHAAELGASEHIEQARPGTRGTKADWASYAQARGADADVVEGMSKQQLIDAYGD